MKRYYDLRCSTSYVPYQGAFWGLMFGLAVGMARMILDFSYQVSLGQPNFHLHLCHFLHLQAPLCMEEDERPWIVAHVHYMYFAAGLFFSTGMVTVLVSLCTEPPREYLVRRRRPNNCHVFSRLSGPHIRQGTTRGLERTSTR